MIVRLDGVHDIADDGELTVSCLVRSKAKVTRSWLALVTLPALGRITTPDGYDLERKFLTPSSINAEGVKTYHNLSNGIYEAESVNKLGVRSRTFFHVLKGYPNPVTWIPGKEEAKALLRSILPVTQPANAIASPSERRIIHALNDADKPWCGSPQAGLTLTKLWTECTCQACLKAGMETNKGGAFDQHERLLEGATVKHAMNPEGQAWCGAPASRRVNLVATWHECSCLKCLEAAPQTGEVRAHLRRLRETFDGKSPKVAPIEVVPKAPKKLFNCCISKARQIREGGKAGK